MNTTVSTAEKTVKKKYDDNFEVDSLLLLNANELIFSVQDSGYLNLHYKDKEYEQVSLIRLIPFYEINRYISVSYQDDDKEWHEIGVIRDIEELNEEQNIIAGSYLTYRYYIPVITKVYSINDNRMGYLFIDADTTAGRKRISVNDWWSNFRIRENNMLNVTDSDGNRYIVPDIMALDKKSMKKLQLFV